MREKCFKCVEYGHFVKDCNGTNSQNSKHINTNNNNNFKNSSKNINNNIIEKENNNLGFNEEKKDLSIGHFIKYCNNF